MSRSLPFLSVIVPVHQGAQILPRSLAALCGSELPRECWELIVVDDASTDDTSLVAARWADTVVRLAGKPHGPAYTRNRGFEASRGEVIVFIDADVAVHADTLRRFATLFLQQPDLGAAFGSYDRQPVGEGVVSRYRNLLHHYVHHRDGGAAETFWAGCGAVRRGVFAEVGMFDEWHYARPQIEDIELGRRIRRSGHRVLLEPAIQGTHLKRWTLRDLVEGDLRNRGVPWMRLLLQEGSSAGARTLNLRGVEKWCTALVGAALGALSAALVLWSAWPVLVAPVAVALVVVLNRRFYQFLHRQCGLWFTVRAVPLHLLYYFVSGISAIAGWSLHHLGGPPRRSDQIVARSSMAMKTWPPAPVQPPTSLWNSTARKARGTLPHA